MDNNLQCIIGLLNEPYQFFKFDNQKRLINLSWKSHERWCNFSTNFPVINTFFQSFNQSSDCVSIKTSFTPSMFFLLILSFESLEEKYTFFFLITHAFIKPREWSKGDLGKTGPWLFISNIWLSWGHLKKVFIIQKEY